MEKGCSTCNNTRLVCDECREADGDCTCVGGPDLLVQCDVCPDDEDEDDGEDE